MPTFVLEWLKFGAPERMKLGPAMSLRAFIIYETPSALSETNCDKLMQLGEWCGGRSDGVTVMTLITPSAHHPWNKRAFW